MTAHEYELLIRPIEAQMMRSVWRITLDADDAEDALQEAAQTIWRRLARVRAHPNPQALILRICVDAACDLMRRRRRREQSEKNNPQNTGENQLGDPLEQLTQQERNAEITAAIAALPARQATAVAMRFLLQQTTSEIADALGCKEATVRVHISRGVEKLRSALAHLNPALPSVNQ